jgi:hypothetical protein
LPEYWILVLITVHGGADNKISLDYSFIDFDLEINESTGLVATRRQDTRLYQRTFQADIGGFITSAKQFSEEYPKVGVTDLLDDLSTPKPENRNHQSIRSTDRHFYRR